MNIFSKDWRINPYLILVFIVLLVSANSLRNDFLDLDDQGLIVHNPHMNLPMKDMPSVFTKTLQAGHVEQTSYYRPILELLYIINYKIWGPNPVGFHLTNLLFHFLSAVFLYRIGISLFRGDKKIPIIAACLWAVHPANNEPLCRVAMNENIYGFFSIVTVYLFIRDRSLLSWFTFSIALLSKESAIMLPFALCLFSIHRDGPKKGIVSMKPYAIVLTIYLVIRQIVVGSFWGFDFPQPLFVRVLTMAAAFFDYARLLIIPYPLHVFYPARLYTSVLDPKILASIVTLTLLLYLALKLKRDKIMLFLFSSPVILLLPVIAKVNAFPVGIDLGYIAERLLYVPSMFFSLFVSAFVIKRFGKGTTHLFAAAAFAVVIITFAFVTFSSCRKWENDTTFYSELAEDAPDSAVTHYHRGTVLFEQGRLNDAYEQFKAAFLPNPSLVKVIMQNLNSSENRVLRNNMPFDLNTLREYQRAFADVHFALGRVFLAQGDIDKAIRKFKVTLILEPHFTRAHYYLSKAYMDKGQFDKARTEFQTFLKRREADGDALHYSDSY